MYTTIREKPLHFATERSDPMKKYICLLLLLVTAFLLFACASSQADLTTSDPDTLSSTPSSSFPSSLPPTDASTAPTETNPTTVPTEPTTSPPIQVSTDWVVENRAVIPFEERFEEDISFLGYNTSWFVNISGNDYYRYTLSKSDSTYPLAVKQNDSVVYQTRCDRDLTDYSPLAADGQWAYLFGDNKLIRADLLTGESTTLEEFSANLLQLYIWACDKDTVFICTLDQDYSLRYYYRDLHSDAEKTMYEGTIPVTPLEDMVFYRPGSTQAPVCWRMTNPDFYKVLKKELNDPGSPFRTNYNGRYSQYWEKTESFDPSIYNTFFLSLLIQEEYDIPARVEYYYDSKAGELTPDYGIICDCERGSDKGHAPFDYEITKEEVPEILDVAPVEIPNISKLTEAQAEAARDINCSYRYYYDDMYYESIYGYPASQELGIYTKLADTPISQMVLTPDYVYCITLENTVIQLSYDGSICNTIYTSDSELDSLHYGFGHLCFIDNNTIIRIDTVHGTWQPVLRTTLKEFFVSGEYEDGVSFGVRQGMYYQRYSFCPETGELQELDPF